MTLPSCFLGSRSNRTNSRVPPIGVGCKLRAYGRHRLLPDRQVGAYSCKLLSIRHLRIERHGVFNPIGAGDGCEHAPMLREMAHPRDTAQPPGSCKPTWPLRRFRAVRREQGLFGRVGLTDPGYSFRALAKSVHSSNGTRKRETDAADEDGDDDSVGSRCVTNGLRSNTRLPVKRGAFDYRDGESGCSRSLC